MWRITNRFFGGMMIAVLIVNFISVYLLHDVDKDRVGRWNLAFFELCAEFLLFGLVVTALFLLFLWCGRALFRTPVSPNYVLAFFMGVLVILLQYPVDLASRVLLPSRADLILTVYPLLSPLFCAGILLLKSRATPGQTT
jgi:hypothetical protein